MFTISFWNAIQCLHQKLDQSFEEESDKEKKKTRIYFTTVAPLYSESKNTTLSLSDKVNAIDRKT